MAFSSIATWDASRSATPEAAVARPFLGERLSLWLRKTGASLLSALVHLLLLWLLVNKLAGGPGDLAGPGAAGEGLTIVDLAEPSAPAAAPRTEAVIPLPPAIPIETDLETSSATELPKPEWSLTRIAVAEPQSQPQPAAAPSASRAGHAGQGAGKGDAGAGQVGGGGAAPYDPFAGAAPLRRTPAGGSNLTQRLFGGAVVAGEQPALVLDRDALAAITRQIGRLLPDSRGTAEFVVRVSPDGLVLAADDEGGSAPARARSALRAALIGKALYRPAGGLQAPQTLRLPIRLG